MQKRVFMVTNKYKNKNETISIPKDIQFHPVTEETLHVDFLELPINHLLTLELL